MQGNSLAERVLKGEIQATARLIRYLDDGVPTAYEELKTLFPHTGKAYIIGITGSPGTGKSTLTSALIKRFRKEGKKVGVVAVDPTSPFTGGAILGDRIRMQEHEGDPGVFIRSVATRGNLGGLSKSTRAILKVLDAMGNDILLVETVGVGQDEVDVAETAHTVLVVTTPQLGDEIQAIKAGILEIADIFVLNKSDLPQADKTERELKMMLELSPKNRPWIPPIIRTVATKQEGIDDLYSAIEKHREYLRKSGEMERKEEMNRVRLFWETLFFFLQKEIGERKEEWGGILEKVKKGEIDPFSGAEKIASSSFLSFHPSSP